MPKNHLSPHDRYIRSILSHPNVAQEFFSNHLPRKILDCIDLSSLELQKESFIDDKLNLQIADLLYKVTFDDQSGYLYLLMEHASTPDKLLPFRMLKYTTAIMDHHLKQTGGKKLPVVYPLILYTGSKPYRYSTNIFDLFESDKKYAKEIYTRPYDLIDLSQVPDETLRSYRRFGAAALVTKHI